MLHLEQQLQALTAQLQAKMGRAVENEAVSTSADEAAEESKETGSTPAEGDSDVSGGGSSGGGTGAGELGHSTVVTTQLQRQLLQAQEVLSAAQSAAAEATRGE